MNQKVLENRDELHDRIPTIQTRSDFIAFARSLAGDFKAHPEEWENQDLESYLEALAAWTGDMDGYYQNRGEIMPEQPSWRMLAQVLLAASVYE